MASKKKLENISVNPVYSAIADATAETAQDNAEIVYKQKERKTYTEQEKREYLDTLKTAGRKGVKLPRINLAFTPDNYDYIQTMARVNGQTLTMFINNVIHKSMIENEEIYKQALDFRSNFEE